MVDPIYRITSNWHWHWQ